MGLSVIPANRMTDNPIKTESDLFMPTPRDPETNEDASIAGYAFTCLLKLSPKPKNPVKYYRMGQQASPHPSFVAKITLE